jgi:hypothetical protein
VIKLEIIFFITVEGVSQTVRGGWLAAAVRIQCFNFGLRGEAMEQSIAVRWSGVSQVIMALWEGSMTRHNGVATSADEETMPGRGKGEDDATWANTNLIGSKNKENPHGQFSYYKWTVKI